MDRALLAASCNQVLRQALTLHAQYEMVGKQRRQAWEKAQQLGARLDLANRAVAILRQMGAAGRERLQGTIELVAAQGLREIFGEDARFEIVFKPLPKSGFSAQIVTGVGAQRGNRVNTHGDSVAQILSDGVLRTLIACLHRQGVNRIIALDEPFAGVDKANLRPLFSLLRGLSDEMGVQFIMVIHLDDEAVNDLADETIRLDRPEEMVAVEAL
jgi:ABC-type glutathione transport system ATPase component